MLAWNAANYSLGNNLKKDVEEIAHSRIDIAAN